MNIHLPTSNHKVREISIISVDLQSIIKQFTEISSECFLTNPRPIDHSEHISFCKTLQALYSIYDENLRENGIRELKTQLVDGFTNLLLPSQIFNLVEDHIDNRKDFILEITIPDYADYNLSEVVVRIMGDEICADPIFTLTSN